MVYLKQAQMNEPNLKRLQNFGFTPAGSAIVDAIWFSGAFTSPASQIGMVLICDQSGSYKAYIGALTEGQALAGEAYCAQLIAADGCKVQKAIALAAFPNRFTLEEYDKATKGS